MPHLGKGRAIHPHQKIHFSVAFKDKGYKPKATLRHIPSTSSRDWGTLVGREASEELQPNDDWMQLLELDLFDENVVDDLIQQLANEKPAPSTKEVIRLLIRLNSMISFRRFQSLK